MAKKKQKITPLQGVLVLAALVVYGIIAKAVIDSGDPWNSLGTLGTILLAALAIAVPLLFIVFWISMLLESLRKQEYIWSIFIFIIPAVSLLYWLTNRQARTR